MSEAAVGAAERARAVLVERGAAEGRTFRAIFLAVTYGLVAVSFTAVATSGEVGTVVPAVFVVLGLVSVVWRPSRAPDALAPKLWTAFVIASFFALVAWSWSDDNWLLHGLEFALLMTMSRLFQRRWAKDYLQLYALTFLLMLVAAVIHPSLTFAISFLLYTVLIVWGLTILHLVRQIEVQTGTGPEQLDPAEQQPSRIWYMPWKKRAPPPDPLEGLPESPVAAETLAWRSRRLIGRRFLALSSLMALGILASSSVFFFLFPRLGMGFFFAQTRGGQAVVGFSDEVELGNFGSIKSSSRVVMRIEYPDEPARLREPVRLRGITFDSFDGRAWSRVEETPRMVRHGGETYDLPRDERRTALRSRPTYLMRIYLEPLDAKNHVLFAPGETRTVTFLDSAYDRYRGRRKRVFWRGGSRRMDLGSGDLTFKAPADTALYYELEVHESWRPAEITERLGGLADDASLPPRLRERWTQLPDGLDPRIPALARQLTEQADTPLQRARALESGLRRGWTYSLAGDQDAERPLEDFLFGKKHGHCEYFSTAMVVLARSVGLPARPVNGYVGGDFNEIGNYRMVRQGDAHSWVEVWFPGHGWQTFDPTPPSGQLAPPDDGIAGSMRRLIDSASMWWYKWIVEYDLERQVAFFRSIGKGLRKLGRAAPVRGFDGKGGADEGAADEGRSTLPPVVIAAILGLVALGLGVVLGRSWWLRRHAAVGFDRAIDALTARVDKQLRRLGQPRGNAQTWRQVALAAGARAPSLAKPLQTFALRYELARYAATPQAAGATDDGALQARRRTLEAGRDLLGALRALPTGALDDAAPTQQADGDTPRAAQPTGA